MKWMFLAGLIFLTISCDVSHGPYLKSKVEMKKLEGNCSGASGQFSMNSNINGERYVFKECFHDGAQNSDVVIQRKGDTVSIQFKKNAEPSQLYELTVDINTHPRYNWLTIGNQTFPIIPAGIQ